MKLPDKGIPEEEAAPQKPVVNNRLTQFRKGAVGRRLKARLDLAKNGTPHQQHLKHEQHVDHMENVQNNPRKYR